MKSHSLYIYIFVLLSVNRFMYTIMWYQVFPFDTNNLLTNIWYQLFLSNINSLHTVIWFQVFLFIINNYICFQKLFLFNNNHLLAHSYCCILTLDWAVNQRHTCVNKWKLSQKLWALWNNICRCCMSIGGSWGQWGPESEPALS